VHIDRFLEWLTESGTKSGEFRSVKTFHWVLNRIAKSVIAERSSEMLRTKAVLDTMYLIKFPQVGALIWLDRELGSVNVRVRSENVREVFIELE
jgi:hypothetical protein